MTELVNPEFCREVVTQYVDGAFNALRDNGEFGRSEGSLIIAQTMPESQALHYFDPEHLQEGPDEDFYNRYVVYEHSFGENPTGSEQVAKVPDTAASFTRKALEKVFGAAIHRKDYSEVLADNPHDVARRDLLAFSGAIIRDVTPTGAELRIPPLVIGYCGLWWYHDEMISEYTAASMRAELTKRQMNS